ncbi:hypothetical protein BGW36DRAFT_362878 [Talaromyces proteolyticus]|uniref:Uncharacterized protein n=1 Tax=Talaromyces proteolyticus TaxID=1131652 RepID=A0AAD4KGI2_9EURO|nr:uncharacterized protein BGW36DRAFT_362878 [Talaromyces proteolyticus]KAH8691848.1 hypothetical protein BGW36DRAFT_362878 [Talaromyces proteolyticus]
MSRLPRAPAQTSIPADLPRYNVSHYGTSDWGYRHLVAHLQWQVNELQQHSSFLEQQLQVAYNANACLQKQLYVQEQSREHCVEVLKNLARTVDKIMATASLELPPEFRLEDLVPEFIARQANVNDFEAPIGAQRNGDSQWNYIETPEQAGKPSGRFMNAESVKLPPIGSVGR